MLRITFLIILNLSILFGESFKADKNIEILAKNISMEENILTATGDVVIYSLTKYITTNKLIYDRNKGTMELFGEVALVQDGEATSFSEYLFIDIEKDLKTTEPLLMVEGNNKLWINSKRTDSNESLHQFSSSTLSSCDCEDPAWNIAFSSADYDDKKKWLNTYNTTLEIDGIPVLYTPYFGFSTDKTRRSGILPPTLGYSSDEGLLYAQPLYYAPLINFDLELIPQLRSDRGYGYETKIRYIDSQYSNLQASFGAFYENNKYFTKENLTNKKHDGWSLFYNRTKLFSKDDHSDGLQIDLVDMNDIDYETTRYDNDIGFTNDKILTSSVKYYYNTNNYFGNVEFERLKDLSKVTNADTLQTLPQIHLHKYTNNLFFDNLTYSIDANYLRNTRSKGLTADIHNISIPVIYKNSFFNDYLDFSIGEELELAEVNYKKNNTIFNDGKYATLSHFLKLETNLLKPYNNYLHTVNLSATYKKPEVFEKSGDLYNINVDKTNPLYDPLELFPINKRNEYLELALNSSLYSKETLNQVLNYKISQLYTYNDTTNSYKKDDLSQSLRLYYGNFILSNDLSYSHDLNKIVLSSVSLDFQYKQSFFNAYYKYSKDKTTLDNQEDLVYTIGYNFDKYYSVAYQQEIDLSTDLTRKKEYIFGIDKKCWALNLKYVDSIVASDTSVASTKRQDIVYIEFHLKELFKLNQKYKSK